METKSFHLETSDTKSATKELESWAADLAYDPDMIFVFYGCTHDAEELQAWFQHRFPQAAFLGGSSSGGIMSDQGLGTPSSVAVLALFDAEGDFGSAIGPKGSDPQETAAAAAATLERALVAADCDGLLPDLVWVYQSPGQEEAVLEGLRSKIGVDCPVFGGSAADNDLSGCWTQIGPESVQNDGICVAVFFPSGEFGVSFQGGYEPTGHYGKVELAQDDPRSIAAIDGMPAAKAYNQWTDGLVDDQMEGGNILAETTKFPLGVEIGKADGVQQYQLVHPERVTESGAMTTFANLRPGSEIHCMTGNITNLTTRAGLVARKAAADLTCDNPAAALIVYCGGCRLAIGEAAQEVPVEIKKSLPEGTPFVGTFTFGEQGALLSRNMHGNLMISAVVFGG